MGSNAASNLHAILKKKEKCRAKQGVFFKGVEVFPRRKKVVLCGVL